MDPTNDLSFHPSSPSSESVYFDAVETLPMRFFSKKSSTGVKSEDDQQQAQTADQSPSFATSSSMGTPSRPFRANHYPQPIVDSSPTGDEPGVERTYRESLQSDTTASDLPTHNEVPQRMPQAVAMPEANIDSGHPPASQAPGSSSAHQRNESTSTNAHASDSGYGSPTNQHRRSKSLGSSGRAPIAPVEESAEAKTPGANNEIKPIPILWQESPEGQGNVSRMRSQRTARGEDGGNETLKRSGSVRSTRSGYASDRDRGDQLSIRTTPSMRRRRVDLSSGSFAGGAGTVGPNAEPDLDDTLSERRVAANAELSKKQKLRLSKAEGRFQFILCLETRELKLFICISERRKATCGCHQVGSEIGAESAGDRNQRAGRHSKDAEGINKGRVDTLVSGNDDLTHLESVNRRRPGLMHPMHPPCVLIIRKNSNSSQPVLGTKRHRRIYR